jgi:hypothetical protein
MLQHFLKNVETFFNALVGGKIKNRQQMGFWWAGSSHAYLSSGSYIGDPHIGWGCG